MQKEVVMMEIKKVLPVIFTLRSDFHQFSFNADCWSDFYIHRNDAGNSHGLINPHLGIYGSKVYILNTIFYNLAWTLWREESSFCVCLFTSYLGESLLCTANPEHNRKPLNDSPLHGPDLLFPPPASHLCAQSHTQTNTQYLWLSHSVDKDSLSSLFLTCKHTQLGSEMSISRLIRSLFSLRSASLTPHLSQ